MEEDILNNLSEEQKTLTARVLDLALFRIFKNVYLKQNGADKKKMEEVISSGNVEEIEKFLKPHVKDFENLFKAEVKKLEDEIKKEINYNLRA